MRSEVGTQHVETKIFGQGFSKSETATESRGREASLRPTRLHRQFSCRRAGCVQYKPVNFGESNSPAPPNHFAQID